MNKKLTITIILTVILIFILVFLWFEYNAEMSAINNIEVKIDDIYLKNINKTSFELTLNVNISNPTNHFISDLSSNFDIFIADNYVGKGEILKVSIPKNSNIKKDIITVVYYSGLAEAVVDIILKVITNDKFNLTIDGKMRVNALFGLTSISQDFKITKTYP